MSYESVILILFIIASFVAVAAKKFNLPYTIALVAVGLILGGVHILNPPHLSQELLYSIFLPPLIFEAAIHLKSEDLKNDLAPITMLVVPGVIISTLVTAGVMIPVSHLFHQINSITWPLGILFGAAVAATDPVSVVSLFKKLGAPRRLRIIIESESLLNDGTSIVAFIIAMHFIQHQVSSPQAALLDFVRIVGFGILVGVIVGLLTAYIMQNIYDPMIIITLTTVAAYGSFLIADSFGVSGVMSTVAAGLICGEKGFSGSLLPSIRLSTETFWEYIAFAMNSLIFLLMGFTINLTMLWDLWPVVLIAYTSVLIARVLVVSGTWMIFIPSKWRFPFSWATILTWGGLRGALSMVLALSIPDSFEMKNVIVTLVFGVVLLSIFVQGLTIPAVMKLLKLISPVSTLKKYELIKTETSLVHNTLESIDKLLEKRLIGEKSAESLKDEFQKKLNDLNNVLDEIKPDIEALTEEETLRTKRLILMEQKQTLFEMYQNGTISLEVYETVKNEIDDKLFELENLGV